MLSIVDAFVTENLEVSKCTVSVARQTFMPAQILSSTAAASMEFSSLTMRPP